MEDIFSAIFSEYGILGVGWLAWLFERLTQLKNQGRISLVIDQNTKAHAETAVVLARLVETQHNVNTLINTVLMSRHQPK